MWEGLYAPTLPNRQSSRRGIKPLPQIFENTPWFDGSLYQQPFPRHETRHFLSPGFFCRLSVALLATPAFGKQVGTNLVNSGKKLTNIKIRVGSLGEEQISIAILDQIKADL